MKRLIVLLAVIGLLTIGVWAEDTLDVYFLDVGQGDAILVDHGEWECLIDTGHQSSWRPDDPDWRLLFDVVCPPIDAFILSHADQDHYSAFVAIASTFGIGQVIHGPDQESEDIIGELVTQLEEDAPAMEIQAGQIHAVSADSSAALVNLELDWGILHPACAFAADQKETNENSLVLTLTFGSVIFLFPGDIQRKGAAALANLELDAEQLILKAPHHGSANGLPFLDLVNPDDLISVISVGETHWHKHPNASVMEALSAVGDVYVTTLGNPNGCIQTGVFPLQDRPNVFVDVGTIRVTTDGSRVWVTTSSLGKLSSECNVP